MNPSTVNLALTAQDITHHHPGKLTRGPRRAVENDDYARFARRIVLTYGGRIAAGDIEGLAELAALSRDMDAAMTVAVTGLRATGFSWTDIAGRLGVTRQAAHQRFGATS